MKIIPITTSLLSPERSFKNNIIEAAKPPEINAPAANGIPIKYAPATPGTTECARASPIKDHPLSIK